MDAEMRADIIKHISPNGGPAAPLVFGTPEDPDSFMVFSGMSKREQIAIAAMQAMIPVTAADKVGIIVPMAFIYADAMLEMSKLSPDRVMQELIKVSTKVGPDETVPAS